MKTLFNNLKKENMNQKLLKIVFFLTIIPLMGFAGTNPVKGKYEKSKKINKEFNVNANALLNIHNKYGNVDVISWNENRVVIEVEITVSGNNESKVQQKLSDITVTFESSKSKVSAKTVFGKKSGWSNWKNNSNISFEVNYKVKMPVTNQADFSNDYGSISLNELKARASINCDYGKIIIGSLYDDNNNINIDYTNNSTIEFINGGNINADYSGLTVEKAKAINLNADYTSTTFENVEDLNFNCDYGNVEVGQGNNINGNGDYLSMKFGTVYKNLKIDADYGSLKVEKLMQGFESVKIDTDYTSSKIGLDPAASFNFILNLSYAGFSYSGDNINCIKKIVKNTSKYYEGYVNKENPSSTIEISSDYGGVKFYNN
jgi:hypothetical protein